MTDSNDLIERVSKYLDAIPDDLRRDNPNELIALLDECLEALRPVEDEEISGVQGQIESGIDTANNEIHGFDYHAYCTIHEALSAADDLIERLARESESYRNACKYWEDVADRNTQLQSQLAEAKALNERLIKRTGELTGQMDSRLRELAEAKERIGELEAQIKGQCDWDLKAAKEIESLKAQIDMALEVLNALLNTSPKKETREFIQIALTRIRQMGDGG